MTVDDIRLRFEDTVRARLGATALRRVAALGVVLVVVGGCAPWAGFAGFPGKMTLPLWYAFPGGARLFVLVLTLGFALVVLRDLPGAARRRPAPAGGAPSSRRCPCSRWRPRAGGWAASPGAAG